MRLPLTLLLSVALLAVAPEARADEDQAALAAQMQVSAIEAMTAGDWEAAEERARAALSLDPGVRMSQARLVLIRALEQRGAVKEALAELDTLLAMDLLPQHRQKGEEVQQRLKARGPAGPAPLPAPAALDPKTRKWLGVGLAAGGAVPIGLGITFVGFDAHFASQDIESGGWAILGASLLGTGIALEVVGIHLITSSPEGSGGTAATRLRWTPTAGLAPTRDRVTFHMGVVGRW